jgi:hypothetical protein
MNKRSFQLARFRGGPGVVVLLGAIAFLAGCVSQGERLPEGVLLRESFGEEYSMVGKPTRWHWVPFASEVWINEADDVPEGYGPWVLTLGRGSNSTAHIALKSDALAGETDYEVSVLWVDRTIVGELNDSDFHVGVRAQPTEDMELEAPERLYEVEVDGDKADATNLIPDDGPTHFHLFIRGDVQRALDHATAEEFPQPVRDQWYWTRMRVVGATLQAKTWAHGSEEPDWMLSATDPENRYPSGTIRLGVWSGKAEVAFVEVRKAESAVAEGASDEEAESGDDGQPWESALFTSNADGGYTYHADAEGHRLPDFSYVGFKRGEEPLPGVATVVRLEPASGDDTERIQEAIDEVARRTPDAAGVRGAVELAAGSYEVAGTIELNASGVVLRGEGDDAERGTVIRAVGKVPANRDVLVAGSGLPTNWDSAVSGSRRPIVSSRVPLGSRTIEVSDASPFSVGDNIVIVQPGTEEWMAAIDFGGTANDRPWRTGEIPLVFNRYVTGVDGNELTIDAPLYMELNTELAPSYVYVHSGAGIERMIGVEDLRIEIVPDEPTTASGDASQTIPTGHAKNAILLRGIEDAWVRGVTVTGFQLSGVLIETGSRITVSDVRALDPIHEVVPGALYNFNAAKAAQQVLFTRTHASNGRHHYISNGMSWTSGIVFHRTTSTGAWSASEGHRRWTMGLLFDAHTELDGPRAGGTPILLGLYNRGDYGTGHGWSAVNSVAWNVDVADGFAVIQGPPLAQNFGIGVRGSRVTGRGPFDQPGGYLEGNNRSGLTPESLYEAQLRMRVGELLQVESE